MPSLKAQRRGKYAGSRQLLHLSAHSLPISSERWKLSFVWEEVAYQCWLVPEGVVGPGFKPLFLITLACGFSAYEDTLSRNSSVEANQVPLPIPSVCSSGTLD